MDSQNWMVMLDGNVGQPPNYMHAEKYKIRSGNIRNFNLHIISSMHNIT